jgi:uncharacterized protein YcfJ
MKHAADKFAALPFVLVAMLVAVNGMASAGEVAYDYAEVEWVRPVTRTIATPIAETRCDAPLTDSGVKNGDIRADDPAMGLVEAIRQESKRAPVKPRCRLVKHTVYDEEVVAYEVRYRYAGETYERQLSYDPGDQLQVRIEVSAGAGR